MPQNKTSLPKRVLPMNPAAALIAGQPANNRTLEAVTAVVVAVATSDGRCIRRSVRNVASKPKSPFNLAVTGPYTAVTASVETTATSKKVELMLLIRRDNVVMGGKTLDQFNSRKQARARKTKDTKNSSPKSKDQETDDIEKNTSPLAIK